MQPEEFTLVRDLIRSFAARHTVASADEITPKSRETAQDSLDSLGLEGLHEAATVQERALLAEEHARTPLTTSFLGTTLLAPELLRLTGTELPGRPTLAVTDTLAWDCDGADSALHVDPRGTVILRTLGPPARTADLLRTTRTLTARTLTTPTPTPRSLTAPPLTTAPEPLARLTPDARHHWHAYTLVIVSSELTATARALVGHATAHARDRHQYGRPIASFQAVQHLLADATVLVEACTSATRYAAWCLDHEPPAHALRAARVAKAEANSSAVEAVYAAMQVFGGIAQTWEHLAHLHLRRVLVDAALFAGTPDLLSALAAPEATR
ncbi:acyl-CoA dehydrogenase family protein [Streptomyces sp. NPDC004539]|uniref:acyl-CoA dehydrogenase family protein n=1 Tax=Streptomyces sp. NPDC004539 TaxID=3154280 RepID=UPI0033B89195